jgi:hypothetical protein
MRRENDSGTSESRIEILKRPNTFIIKIGKVLSMIFALMLVVAIGLPTALFLVMTLFGRPNPFAVYGVEVAYIRWSSHADMGGDVAECRIRTMSDYTLVFRNTVPVNNLENKTYAVYISGIKDQSDASAAMKQLRSDPQLCVREMKNADNLDIAVLFPYLPNCICLDQCS